MLVPQNTGTQDDSYTATIVGTTGPVDASLIGLNGLPTQSIPLFDLPGLTSGAIDVDANLLSPGEGTVTVQVTSTDGTVVAPPVTFDVANQSAVGNFPIAVSSTATGVYGPGTTIPITVDFGQTVTVTGTPQLALNAGTGAVATYSSGSGTSTLTFLYTVASSGQSTSDLDYTSINALTLNGGTIDASGFPVSLVLPSPGVSGDSLFSQDIAVGAFSDNFTSDNSNFSQSEWPWQLSSTGAIGGQLVGANEQHSPQRFRRPVRGDRRREHEHAEHHPHRGQRRRVLLLAECLLECQRRRAVVLHGQRPAARRDLVGHGGLAGVVLLGLSRNARLYLDLLPSLRHARPRPPIWTTSSSRPARRSPSTARRGMTSLFSMPMPRAGP